MTIDCTVCLVQWIDASVEPHAEKPEDLKGLSVLLAVGWLIKETTDYLVLAIEHPGAQSTRMALTIPRSRIVHSKTLTVPKVTHKAVAQNSVAE